MYHTSSEAAHSSLSDRHTPQTESPEDTFCLCATDTNMLKRIPIYFTQDDRNIAEI